MPTENHIIIDKGTTLHPETNSNQVYDYVRGKWVQEVITDIVNKRTTWGEVQNKPTEFAPSAHTHATSDIRGLDADLQRLSTAIENVTLPIATTEVLGGIKPDGNTITVNPGTGIASVSVQDASTTQKGIVQLNDSLTSNSTVQAATANSVRTLNDKTVAPVWTPLNLNDGFVNKYGGNPSSYRVYNGRIEVRLSIVANSGHSAIIATLPANARVFYKTPFIIYNGTNSFINGIVLENGNISFTSDTSYANLELSAIFTILI